MSKLQVVFKKHNKYEQLLEYVKQDNGYWFDNDIWEVESLPLNDNNKLKSKLKKNIDMSYITNFNLKLEVKYYFLFNIKNSHISLRSIANVYQNDVKYLINYITSNKLKIDSFADFYFEDEKFRLSLLNTDSLTKQVSFNKSHVYIFSSLPHFMRNFYDEREETEKDIWNCRNIIGVKMPASQSRQALSLNFTLIPYYYRDTVKRYFRTIITKKSLSTCLNTLVYLNYFFNYFYRNGYNDGFLENVTRNDIEKYIFHLMNDRNNKNKTDRTKYITMIRTFLEYIQIARYHTAPEKDISFLIFQNDIPKRELNKDEVKRAKFIPEPILNQLDSNIMDLDRPQYIPIYILLRETGWRGTDVLNLRYHNCLEKIWNKKENNYNCYLCGEITKTGISQLKIPIRDKVAEMLEKCISKAIDNSTSDNNPRKYLFNIYKGKHMGEPYQKLVIIDSIKRLIEQKDIKDVNGNLYHFKLHSLRHTRAKEYVEQGMSVSIIQQILGHTSLQMTVHYATVTENTLYEKWKQTEDLDLFRVNTETNELQQVVLDSDDGESLIRYEYVKKNLDAVKVPFGVCFKPSKLPCKQQMNHCLTCASFCTTIDNIAEYEEEIEQVKKQIEISERCGRELWAEKNKEYLKLLEDTLEKIRVQKLVHKNGQSRED